MYVATHNCSISCIRDIVLWHPTTAQYRVCAILYCGMPQRYVFRLATLGFEEMKKEEEFNFLLHHELKQQTREQPLEIK